MLATTAAAPAVQAKQRADARKSKALGEVVVDPTTFRSRRPGSSLLLYDLVGDLGLLALKKGELEGVNRRFGW